MKQIPLSTGGFTIVDEAEYESLCQYKWHVSRCGHRTYARRYERINTENGKARYATIRIHCQIMGHVPGMEIDHINGDGLDNRRENLRHCTRSQNIMNARKYKGKHKYKGVYLSGSGKWAAVIFKEGKKTHIGVYDTIEEAAQAYDGMAKILFGQFARLNFPEQTPEPPTEAKQTFVMLAIY